VSDGGSDAVGGSPGPPLYAYSRRGKRFVPCPSTGTVSRLASVAREASKLLATVLVCVGSRSGCLDVWMSGILTKLSEYLSMSYLATYLCDGCSTQGICTMYSVQCTQCTNVSDALVCTFVHLCTTPRRESRAVSVGLPTLPWKECKSVRV
jgi:hypothetical protein